MNQGRSIRIVNAAALALALMPFMGALVLPDTLIVSGQTRPGEMKQPVGTSTQPKKPSTTPKKTAAPPRRTTSTSLGVPPKPLSKLRAGSVVSNKMGMEFAFVPAGSFMMGSDNGEGDERPVHRVTIREGFYIGRYEVTQAEWQAVMGNNSSYFNGCNRCPAELVGWDDTQEFIQRLNAIDDGHIYRLPTEAEWEYAARAGTTGDYAGNLDSMAWYEKNSGEKTHPVGQKQPNAWGLYDMHGNVWEWVQDWYEDYPSGEVTNPQGLDSGSFRVNRGGSFGFAADQCRSANRHEVSPSLRSSSFGFRLVRTSR